MKSILFVCTGNTCRSPMANALFINLLDEYGLSGRICSESRGFSTADGSRVAKNAVLVMNELGIDISGHVPSQLTLGDIDGFDLFSVMTDTHAYILEKAGVPSEKINVLGSGISDPYGESAGVYRACRDDIKEALVCLISQL